MEIMIFRVGQRHGLVGEVSSQRKMRNEMGEEEHCSLVRQYVFAKYGHVVGPYVSTCHDAIVADGRAHVVLDFPTQIESFVEIALVLRVGIFAQQGSIAFEVATLVNVELQSRF